MNTLAIFGDKPSASTGMAVVLRNLSNELSRYFRVIYIARFGCEHGFSKIPEVRDDNTFEIVDCQGGVWDKNLVENIIDYYKPNYCFSEDDWWSAYGIVEACNNKNIPFHFLTPIDSLPIHPSANFEIFSKCDKIYIPNSSYIKINGKKRGTVKDNIMERCGPLIKSVYLPHGCDSTIFYPKKVKKDDKFTFIFIGRIEERKAIGRAILAYEKICNKMDMNFIIRTDWVTPYAQYLLRYIQKKNIPVTLDLAQDVPHYELNNFYNQGNVNLCVSKAGGFEMSILEAGACSVPSIVTDWTFMNENVIHEKTGYKVPVEDFCHPPSSHNVMGKDRIWGNISINALSEQMEWCINNSGINKVIGGYANSYIKDNYKWKDIAFKLKEEILND